MFTCLSSPVQIYTVVNILQDLYVDRLVESVDKLREDIAITEAQITAQLEETKEAKEALASASMEIEVGTCLLYLMMNIKIVSQTHSAK